MRPPDAIRDLAPIRRSVEEFALRCFFEEITKEDFRMWGQILDRMRKDLLCQRLFQCRGRGCGVSSLDCAAGRPA